MWGGPCLQKPAEALPMMRVMSGSQQNLEMDRADIAGYFGSNSESVRDGAYLTISGIGNGNWKIDDVAIYASPLGTAEKE